MKIATLGFDDGVGDEPTLRALREAGIRATFYLVASWLREPIYGGMPLADIRALYDGMEIGCHTLTHMSPGQWRTGDAAREIYTARDMVEHFFHQQRPSVIAWPYGHVPAEGGLEIATQAFQWGRVTTAYSGPDLGRMTMRPTAPMTRWAMAQGAIERGDPVHLTGHGYELARHATLLPCIVATLSGAGYRFVTASEYFAETCGGA